jgi:hypothetical protein
VPGTSSTDSHAPLHVSLIFAQGSFRKFCDNTGGPVDIAAGWDRTLAHFMKFAYEQTNGFLMVADLQGVKDCDGRFQLTDPVLLCTDVVAVATRTNLGGQAISTFVEQINTLLNSDEL